MKTSKSVPDILTERQVFYISEFQAEAAWLSFMHREGWKMISTTGFKYRFKSCPQENWTYQLDFRTDDVSEEEYIRMFADYGWEYVTRFRQWYYFRKPYSEEEDMSIFSDNASKISMCRSIIRQHALRVLPIFLVVIIYVLLYFFTDLFSAQRLESDFWSGLCDGAAIGGVFGLIIASGILGSQFYRLKKIIDRLGITA